MVNKKDYQQEINYLNHRVKQLEQDIRFNEEKYITKDKFNNFIYQISWMIIFAILAGLFFFFALVGNEVYMPNASFAEKLIIIFCWFFMTVFILLTFMISDYEV